MSDIDRIELGQLGSIMAKLPTQDEAGHWGDHPALILDHGNGCPKLHARKLREGRLGSWGYYMSDGILTTDFHSRPEEALSSWNARVVREGSTP